MSNQFWKAFPTLPGLHCIEMKDRVQGQVRKETRDVMSEGIVAYFHEASCRFRREIERTYPEPTVPLMAVRESDPRQKREDNT